MHNNSQVNNIRNDWGWLNTEPMHVKNTFQVYLYPNIRFRNEFNIT